ncbi:unnamed protein product [Aphis gossypii]|uniref:Uncharacterized protein n=1 Tax=Aphis gossypii TaxID=80765 RepID=A0A9P0NQS8_APHGO|nr:unnamed protein product [Aphis gossypii]
MFWNLLTRNLVFTDTPRSHPVCHQYSHCVDRLCSPRRSYDNRDAPVPAATGHDNCCD